MRRGVTTAAVVAACLTPAPIASAAGERTIVNILDRAPLYSVPGGPPMGFEQTLLYERGAAWVIRRQGDWLGISTIERNHGRLAWIRRTPRRPLTTTRMLVLVDLSERRVDVRLGGRPLMSAPVTVGAPGSPSPIAKTSVRRRIEVTPSSGFDRRSYGPVIIALRLWQHRPSPGMPTAASWRSTAAAGSRAGGPTAAAAFACATPTRCAWRAPCAAARR